MKLLALFYVALAVAFASGCAQIPVSRTYSLSGGYGKAQGTISVRLDPPPRPARDPKQMREPVTTIDFRRERIVDPGTPELRPLVAPREVDLRPRTTPAEPTVFTGAMP